MKIGDYVRTKDGVIGKIIDDNLAQEETRYEIDYNNKLYYFQQIAKSSPNIIDLISRFDLVNGHLVICKMYEDEKDIPTIIKCVGDYYFKEEDIKSIVTREMFESMEYKVGE